MDIYLSVNNREDVLRLPVLPSSISISKPQHTETFDLYQGGQIRLMGEPELKSISWEGIFPCKNYSFNRQNDCIGFDCVEKIDTWIKQKYPIRLVITDTDINIAVAVTSFSYSMDSTGDLAYSIEFGEVIV